MCIDSTCSTKDFFSRLLSLLKSRRYAKKSNDDFAAKYHIMTTLDLTAIYVVLAAKLSLLRTLSENYVKFVFLVH